MTHLSTARNFMPAIAAGGLHARFCPVFGTKLLYLFYGGIFYRARHFQTKHASELPVAFVFHPRALVNVKRYYPFDTGAVASGRCGRHADALGDFKFTFAVPGGDVDIPRKLVSTVFRSNRNYLLGKLDKRCQRLPPPFPSLFKFLRTDLSRRGIDRRQYSIECHCETSLTLGDSLLWVGFPAHTKYWANFRELCSRIAPHRPRYYAYDVVGTNDPLELSAVLESRARQDLAEYVPSLERRLE